MFSNPILRLDFPKLRFLEKVNVQHPKKTFRISLFKLDWSEHQRKKFESLQLNENINYIDIPKDVINEIDNFVFALNNDYLNQIKLCSTQAYSYSMLMNIKSDTMVREYCYKPINANIDVVFFLLSDCLFDLNTKYFLRKDELDLNLAHSMMLWRYWAFKTGRGLLYERCKIDKIEKRIENLDTKQDQIRKKSYEDHVEKFNNWLNNLNCYFENLQTSECISQAELI